MAQDESKASTQVVEINPGVSELLESLGGHKRGVNSSRLTPAAAAISNPRKNDLDNFRPGL